MKFIDMVAGLEEISDTTWGHFAFKKEITRNKIDNEKRLEMIEKSIDCGYSVAKDIKNKFGNISPQELAKSLKIDVRKVEGGISGNHILFATYSFPDKITLMKDVFKLAENDSEISEFISERQIEDLILAHEIFHFLEQHDENIYSRKTTVPLWKLFFYEHKSQVRANSEIAAMCFAKAYNNFNLSCFALDIIIYYAYNQQGSRDMYGEVMELKD